MGQVLQAVQDKFQCKDWKKQQLRKITEKYFSSFKDEEGKVRLTFEDLYVAVLLIYNDLNKHLPGPHYDPPPKEQVKALMEVYDLNLDGELDCKEFAGFIEQLTSETLALVSQGLIITIIAAPIVALMTKRATEGVPGVGKVVQKVPNSVYASLVTLIVMFYQQQGSDFE